LRSPKFLLLYLNYACRMSDLVPLFDNSKKIDAARASLRRKFSASEDMATLFQESECTLSDEGSWIPQKDYGHEWDSRNGIWVKSLDLTNAD